MYIKYLELPTIPNELLESLEVIINKPTLTNFRDIFHTKEINQNLSNWLNTNLSFDFIAHYQVIYKGIRIHKDVGRIIAYNYLLATGGNEVSTTIFNNSLQPLDQKIIPLHQWHSIPTDMYHEVSGLVAGNHRVSLSITPK